MSAKKENTVMLIAKTIWQQGYNIYLQFYHALLASLAWFELSTRSQNLT